MKKVTLKDLRPNRTEAAARRRLPKSPKTAYRWTVTGASLVGTAVGLFLSTAWEIAECQYWGIQDVAMTDPTKWRIVVSSAICGFSIPPVFWLAYHLIRIAAWLLHQFTRGATWTMDWLYWEYLNPLQEICDWLNVRKRPAGFADLYRIVSTRVRVAFLQRMPRLIQESLVLWLGVQLLIFVWLLPTSMEITQNIAKRVQAGRDTFFVFVEDGTPFVVLRVVDGTAHARSLDRAQHKLGALLKVRKLEAFNAEQEKLGPFPPYKL